MMHNARHKRIVASGMVVVLCAHLTLLSFIVLPKKAYAQWAVVESGPALIDIKATAISTASIATGNAAIVTNTGISAAAATIQSEAYVAKEMPFGLDTIVWFLVNTLIEEMLRSTTQWVNSGFKGSPAFITNMDTFLKGIADNVAGAFIEQIGLGFFCSPFRINIQAALAAQYSSTHGRDFQCRLSSVVDNLEGFISGDFLAGGWDGWFQLAAYPQNNPYGSMYLAQTGLAVSIQNAQGKELKLADWGAGFLTVKMCEEVPSGPAPRGSTSYSAQQCSNVTPGAFVQHQINTTFDIPAGRLTIADEVDELLGTLLIQLAKQALGGAGGLRGLTDSQYGDGNYYDRIRTEMADTHVPAAVGSKALTDIKKVIADETAYRSATNALLARLTGAQNYKRETYGTSTLCATGTLTASLESKRQTAIENASSSIGVIKELQDIQADLRMVTNASSTSQVALSVILRKYQASTAVYAQMNILSAFSGIRTGGILHSPGEAGRIQLQVIPEVRKEIQTFTDTIDAACSVTPTRRTVIFNTTPIFSTTTIPGR